MRLEHGYRYCRAAKLLNFNSIKVRLERVAESAPTADTSFQFHKGAIRTSSPLFAILLFRLFQFHKGAIRTRVTEKSIMSAYKFQFHKGAIRT